MNQYQPQGFSYLPLVVKNLLIINILVYVCSLITYYSLGIDVNNYIGLYYFESSNFHPYQLVTHFFAHAFLDPQGKIYFFHIFFNMFSLWMFGTAIENIWGPKRFLIFYVVTALGAAFLHTAMYSYEVHQLKAAAMTYFSDPNTDTFEVFINKYVSADYKSSFRSLQDAWATQADNTALLEDSKNFVNQLVSAKINDSNVVGASGAIYGILMAFGMLFPNSLLYLFFFFPIKAKYVVMGCIAYALYNGFYTNPGDNVAHFAHLGGMLFGYLLIKYWQRQAYR